LGHPRGAWWGVNRPPTLRLVSVDRAGEPDDVALVRALVAREDWAATAIWHRYAPMVYGVLDRALGSAGESEDLTQEVFWRIFAAIRNLREPSALRSFIYSATVRMLRWHLRSKKLRRIFLLSNSGEMPDRPVPAADSEGRELLGRFYRLLDTLSANDRTSFVLRHVEGLGLREIAEATGASLATVKRRVRRASDRITVLAKADPELVHYVVRRGDSDDR
jgi:RNA polymerase sigma-70 factor (ECF subfamily)